MAPAVSARKASSAIYSATCCSVWLLWITPTKMAFSECSKRFCLSSNFYEVDLGNGREFLFLVGQKSIEAIGKEERGKEAIG